MEIIVIEGKELHLLRIAAHVGAENFARLVCNARCNGYNLVHHAAAWGRHRIIQILEQQSDVDLKAKTKRGETALGIASRNGHQRAVTTIQWLTTRSNVLRELRELHKFIKTLEKDKHTAKLFQTSPLREELLAATNEKLKMATLPDASPEVLPISVFVEWAKWQQESSEKLTAFQNEAAATAQPAKKGK